MKAKVQYFGEAAPKILKIFYQATREALFVYILLSYGDPNSKWCEVNPQGFNEEDGYWPIDLFNSADKESCAEIEVYPEIERFLATNTRDRVFTGRDKYSVFLLIPAVEVSKAISDSDLLKMAEVEVVLSPRLKPGYKTD